MFMLKKLALLLLSAFVLPSAVATGAVLSNEPTMVRAEESETLHGYTYVDEYSGTDHELYRTFDDLDLCPKLNRNFYAPSGYIFTLELSEEQANEMVDQMVFMGSQLSWIELIFSYKMAGSKVSVQRSMMPSFPDEWTIEERKTYLGELFLDMFNEFKLFQVENAVSEFTIAPHIDIRFTRPNDVTAHVVFNGYTIRTTPFSTKDFIKVRIDYVKNGTNAGHANIYAVTTNGFFKESPDFNKYGWVTDSYVGAGEEEFAKFTFSLYAFEDVPLALNLPTLTGVLEMSYPDYEIPIKAVIEFDSNGEHYSFESGTVIFQDPDSSILIDNYIDKTAIQKDTEHKFSLYYRGMDLDGVKTINLDANAVPYRLNDAKRGHDLYNESGLPSTGIIGDYYYVPSEHEKQLYNAGHIDELNALPYEGTYYYYDGQFKEYEGVCVFDVSYDETDDEPIDDLQSLLTSNVSFSYAGRWILNVKNAEVISPVSGFMLRQHTQTLVTFSDDKTQDSIELSIPDSTNLVLGAGDVTVIPTITTASGLTDEYFFDYQVSRNGIVNITQDVDDKFIIEPVHTGLITLTVGVESSLFPRMEKVISIRVLDAIYDASKIEVADEFHKAGQDIEVALNIRGFTSFQNLDIKWTITNKKGEEVPQAKIDAHKDATMTLLNPDSDDYTIKAYHEDILLDTLTVQVRYVDMNKFLRTNIWWIVVITLGFVFVAVFLSTITRRGKTTVQRIERVYGVYCQCISNDTLSESELKRIKKEITTCLHHLEDLNIDAFNQYEKATRYLRKSLADTKVLMAKYNELSPEEKGVLYEKLNSDLGKALNVAKEIEEAKTMSEQYHSQANRHNYESIEPEKKDKK